MSVQTDDEWGLDLNQSFVVEDEPDRTLPVDTIFKAQLVDLKPKTIRWTDKNTGDPKSKQLLSWIFEITAGEFQGERVKTETDVKVSNHPANRFRPIAETLLGRELAPGDAITPGELLGLSCELTVKHRADRKDPNKVWVEVDDLLPTNNYDDTPPF